MSEVSRERAVLIARLPRKGENPAEKAPHRPPGATIVPEDGSHPVQAVQAQTRPS